MIFTQLYDLIHSDGDLWKKAEVAAWKAATAIKYESAGTTNHAARMTWANDILANPAAWVTTNKLKLLENASLQTSGHLASDNDVEYVVISCAPAAA